MRSLSLHVSALNDEEYDLFTSALSDLAAPDDNINGNQDDAYFENLSIGVREARAWLRGRYSNIPVSDIDSILKLFHPNLGFADCLTGGQFFAAFRLVIHVEGGKEIDKALAFVQAHPKPKSPTSRPPTPPGRQIRQQPPPTPTRRPTQPLEAMTSANIAAGNPFTSPSSPGDSRPSQPLQPPTTTPLTQPTVTDSITLTRNQSQYQSQPNLPAPPHSPHNPFLARSRSAVVSSSAKADITTRPIPPLPPRKPPPPAPHPQAPVLRDTSLPFPIPNITSGSLNPNLNPPPIAPKPASHVTSTLMRQSLQASKTAQSLKKAEEQLEKERVMQVLKSTSGNATVSGSGSGVASATRTRSMSPSKLQVREGSTAPATRTSGSGSEERSRERWAPPPLPRRRTQQPSPPYSASSTRSLEQIASASIPHPPTSPFPFGRAKTYSQSIPSNSQTVSMTSSPHVSPPRTSVDLPHPAPPPVHPDRRYSHGGHVQPSQSVRTASPSDDASAFGREAFSSPSYAASRDVFAQAQDGESSPVSPSTRVFRSRSLHHPSPPVPPPRRRRPESVQLTPTDSPFASPFGYADTDANAYTPDSPSHHQQHRHTPRKQDGLSRHVSLSHSLSAPSGSPRSHTHKRDSSTSIPDSSAVAATIQRTLAKLDASLHPKFDAARYKAEAGLSRRGFVNHEKLGARGRWVEEGERGLMADRDEVSVDRDEEDGLRVGSPEGDEEDSGSDGGESRNRDDGRRHRSGSGWDEKDVLVEQDNLKWPAGEGWKPL